MLYTWKVRFLKTQRGNLLWRYWRAWRGNHVGEYKRLPEYIRNYAPGHSFVDIGAMWGVNGEYAFIAEEVGQANRWLVFGQARHLEIEAAGEARVRLGGQGHGAQGETQLAAVGTADPGGVLLEVGEHLAMRIDGAQMHQPVQRVRGKIDLELAQHACP